MTVSLCGVCVSVSRLMNSDVLLTVSVSVLGTAGLVVVTPMVVNSNSVAPMDFSIRIL